MPGAFFGPPRAGRRRWAQQGGRGGPQPGETPSPSLTQQPGHSSSKAAQAAGKRWGCLRARDPVWVRRGQSQGKAGWPSQGGASREPTGAWRARGAMASAGGTRAGEPRSLIVCPAPRLRGRVKTEAPQSWRRRLEVRGMLARAPMSAGMRGPDPACGARGPWAWSVRPQPRQGPGGTRHGARSLSIGGRSTPGWGEEGASATRAPGPQPQGPGALRGPSGGRSNGGPVPECPGRPPRFPEN
jgi:hypothetical protein